MNNNQFVETYYKDIKNANASNSDTNIIIPIILSIFISPL